MCALRWSVAVTYSCSCNMLKVCVQVVPHRVRLTHKARPLHPARCLVATMATKPSIQIEVMSDTVCPWCYIGKRRLEKAMKQFSDKADFKVHWLPFQLNPDAPLEGVNKIQSYNDKFGPARVAQMVPAMEVTAAAQPPLIALSGQTEPWRSTACTYMLGYTLQHTVQCPRRHSMTQAVMKVAWQTWPRVRLLEC
eukprot:GHUV01019254.1.p1 GENE.GHUV01019254.1~~GHUV01019254.1.p1  ORF type:complete len:194 (+),score=3.27 GHUV01019254.1:206-787(+)